MLQELTGPFPYVAIFAAAVIEGEVVFLAASTLAGQGVLDPVAVWLAGAAGGSLGDQAYFYLFHGLSGRFYTWLDRWAWVARRRGAIVARVQRHACCMIVACRFLPGLRIAIPAACAYAGVSALTFTSVSILAGLIWAGTLLALVAYLGPGVVSSLGLSGWWGALVAALLWLAFVRWLAHHEEAAESLVNEDSH